MANFSERFLFFSTQPRNPKLFPKVIRVIQSSGLDGKEYNEKLQSKFYDEYSKLKITEQKSGKAKDKEFAGRQLLTRAPQALGLIISRKKEKLKVTEAGKLIVEDSLFEDVLLHQLLKFQLPSPLHRETKKNKGRFNIKPFLELLRLIDTLGYLTYQELTIFGMTLTDYRNFDKTVNRVREYRKKRDSIRGHQSLRKFSSDEQEAIFYKLYKDQIDAGDINTRESKTSTTKSFMKKKTSNWGDYTDSIFRSLHATGLLVMSKGRTLSISDSRKDEVRFILKSVNRNIVSAETSREKFDQYITNPNIPILLSDNKSVLISQLDEYRVDYNEYDTLYNLKKKLYKARELQRSQRVEEIANELKQRNFKDIEDILTTYDQISSKEIVDRPMMFEWNTWRAMSMIDHGEIKGNFKPDDNGMPISTASGDNGSNVGQGDIVGDYGKFKIVVEVTLSSGKRQYDMESEPVTRHVGEQQGNSNVPVFGLFIADKLNDTVIDYFYKSNLINSSVYKGHIDVIPMSTDTFKEFFRKASSQEVQPETLFKIHEYSTRRAKEAMINDETETEWHMDVINHMMSIIR
ncbi:AlwI family type II restriction endonuclease [Lactiplantibacillus plantarum]|uniref:AlwI family type II restriction endonuclease n=1 Tax=Lactiplantibacillus plantarum TaxID=1590 RepID=UPI002ADDAF4C|nr:AlwI family type II restriction endonuclease [Lactiplantibacillus plantarum]MEA0995309.1 AlwI family type II restriction endonuclease [Lactiplantibacillus plantarum]MEA1035086.1 AlwI family type II restriction endonuclease [Lactiplantibacillus plantarum]